jgi:hypothetical protein
MGRPPKLSYADIKSAVPVIERADAANDNEAWAEVLGKFASAAASRGMDYVSNGIKGQMSDRQKSRIKKRCKSEADMVIATGLATDVKRTMNSTNDSSIRQLFQQLIDGILKKHPVLLKEGRRWANLDESDKPGRVEKCARQTKVVTTKKALRMKKRTKGKRVALRTRVMEAGNGKLTAAFCLCGDSTIITEAYVIKGASVPPTLLAPNDDESDFLPGVAHDFFEDKQRVRVYAAKKGSVTREILSTIVREQILPQWRKKVPSGPLVLIIDNPKCHKPDLKLLRLLEEDENGPLYLLYLPPQCTHILQPLDLAWFNALKAICDEVFANIVSVSKGENAYLDSRLRVAFRNNKQKTQRK